ncbi:CsxC family protein [Clostridium tertium]|uniref:CsxC family protein n=1 Tax=Clostridium tertium TaxID=1559 RepID=UPI0034A1251D
MERRYYSRRNYNQLKIKQYEEYVRRLNRYYIYMKKNYEEYIKKQNQQYIYMKNKYEEYIKMQNKKYVYMQKNYEEYIENQNKYYLYNKKSDEEHSKENKDIINTTQSEFFDFFKTLNIEDSNTNNFGIKKSISEFQEVNIKENNLEYKRNDLSNNEYLDNNSNTSTSIKDSPKGKLLEEIYEELCEENDKELLKESHKESLEENSNELLQESDKEINEGEAKESVKSSDKKLLKLADQKLIEENYNTIVKEESSKNINISTKGLYANLPVILAETNITISVEDTITLDQEVNEIKLIKINVFLTKSRLIPFPSSISENNSGMLFVTGFISNNIEYESKTYTEEKVENSSGNIKYCTVEVPFNFTTRITYTRPPIFTENTTINEVEFLNGRLNVYKDSVIDCEQYEQSLVFTEVFNEKPFVELVKANFIEVDINRNPILSNETTIKQEVTKLKERIIVNLMIRVLQKQQLRVEIE